MHLVTIYVLGFGYGAPQVTRLIDLETAGLASAFLLCTYDNEDRVYLPRLIQLTIKRVA